MSPFLSDCLSLMLGIAIHCIQHSQAMLERGVCELAHSFFHNLPVTPWGSRLKQILSNRPLLVVRSNQMERSFGQDHEKPKPCVRSCGTIETPPCSKSICVELRHKVCSLPSAMMTSQIREILLIWKQNNLQSKFISFKPPSSSISGKCK